MVETVETVTNLPSEAVASIVTAVVLGIIRAIEKRRLTKRLKNGEGS